MTGKHRKASVSFEDDPSSISARDEQLGLQAVQRLPNNGKVKFHQLDLRSVESIRRLAEHIRREHGGLDILINNAAIAFKVDRFRRIESFEIH